MSGSSDWDIVVVVVVAAAAAAVGVAAAFACGDLTSAVVDAAAACWSLCPQSWSSVC